MKKFPLEYQKILGKQVDSAMIIFHGYGDSKVGFLDFAQFLSRSFPHMAFYVTNAPDKLMFGGYSWFDLDQSDFEAFESPELAQEALNGLIAKAPLAKVHEFTHAVAEAEGLSSDRIIYTGFSQGGLMALAGGLSFQQRLGGLIAMSAVPVTLGQNFNMQDIRNTPDVLLTHGSGDSVVPFICFDISKRTLLEIGAVVEEKVVSGADHNESVTMSVMEKITAFLKARSF